MCQPKKKRFTRGLFHVDMKQTHVVIPIQNRTTITVSTNSNILPLQKEEERERRRRNLAKKSRGGEGGIQNE